ncbi:MAG TPA: 50S ribosomal protein L24 [Nitrososphaeraceae archaeon]|nr:50S ribosomal protein L24 [Nitrososphaeraceae archaeon]
MINKNIVLNVKKHNLDKHIRSPLSENLRNEYNKKNARVVKGDTVKVLRGEYKNVEGKVEKVKTGRSSLFIEGIQREASKGGKVKVQIHSSNVIITSLNLHDKNRSNVIRNIKSSKVDEKKGVNISSNLRKPRTRRKLNVKKVLKSKQSRITSSKNSQDNKGEDDHDGVRK